MYRGRHLSRMDEAAASKEKLLGSCGQPGSESCTVGDGVSPRDQQGAADHSDDSRAAELQNVGSLKVTIQRSSESREFGQTDRTSDRQGGGVYCHVCCRSCRSLQVFQEHMAGSEHLKKLEEITHSISTHTQPSRGRLPDSCRWCDTCQTHFSGDVIVHRQTKHHKMCKRVSRPFCPVCRRHFRTPRKFVEHMKSAEHKRQVQRDGAQEEELITVDAIGCFEEEDVKVGKNEEEETKAAEMQEVNQDHYSPNTIYGSSFVVPVSGFLCCLCNKFFHQETTARHTHCRTHTHYLQLQTFRQQRDTPTAKGEEDTPALS
ncbi:cdkn1a interacting zinc finger protein 1b [Aulostomus maculatus]